MLASWWQYRGWRFVADMNGDGAVTMSDAPLWAQWVFFVPGDAVIAQFGTTSFGRFLELTPASFGSLTSAGISAVLWLLAIVLILNLPGLVLDILDPTYRQQKRERREAQRTRKRSGPSSRDGLAKRRERLEIRREPRF